MTRVLAIDDDRQLLRALQITLGARGYEVVPVATGAGALAAASAAPPDVVILDLGLPDLDGVAVIEGLRGWCTAPIIVLSARHEERAKVRALDAGADDYVTKPFGMEELLARLRAAVRRTTPVADAAKVETATFTIDLAARRVMAEQNEIRLTPTEWHLLEMLVRNAGKLVTHYW
jgi:two-component system KDP operon response regulator KdpE